MESYTGRIVRRFSVYSQFHFVELRIPGENDQSVSSFPVIIKMEELEAGSYQHGRPGDVVTVFGKMETSEGYYNNTCFSAHRIDLVEKWDSDKYGPFQYIPPWNKRASHTRTVPVVARDLVGVVQCQVDVVNRVSNYLKKKYSSHSVVVEQSLSPLSNSQDRLVGLWVDRNSGTAVSLDDIVQDPILSYTISRVYPLERPNRVAATLDSLTTLVSADLKQLVDTDDESISIRVHAFPKQIPIEKIARSIISILPVTFDPRNFSHTLSIVYINGLWYGSVSPSSCLVGTHLYRGGSSESLEISKASQKLFEAFLRIDDLWGPHFTDLTNKTAIDIGASPGGWSYCMAIEKNAKRVISVDNGLLSHPKPSSVEHWKNKGEEAIFELLSNPLNNNTISCYTCDMNTDCGQTVELFLESIPLMVNSSIAILTFKKTIKNKEKWEEKKHEAISRLTAGTIGQVEEVHLIANTPNETTILVRLDF